MIQAIYIAHPLGPDGPTREWNRQNAARWCGWISKTFRVATVADWIVLSGVWDEAPENRELGLSLDLALVARCDAVWMVGKNVSLGMAMEATEAARLGKPVLDFTGATPDGAPPQIGRALSGYRWDAKAGRLPGLVVMEREAA